MELAIAALRRLPYGAYLRTAHWHRVRTLALERAGYACALCPVMTTLQVHHRSYARLGFEQPEDVIVLCRACHQRHHGPVYFEAIDTREPEPILTAEMIRWSSSALSPLPRQDEGVAHAATSTG